MNTPVSSVQSPTTAAFFLQAAISFGVSVIAVTLGIIYLPIGGWPRAFLGLGMLYAVTSTFTLAKVIRDRQEQSSVVSKVEQARIDRLLTENDPFKSAGV